MWRENVNDAVYAIPGFLIQPANGSQAHYVGDRPGTELRWQATPHLWCAGDFGIFRAGRFLKEAGPGKGLDYSALYVGYKSKHKYAGRNMMNSLIRPYEPLTSDNAAVILVDHQIGLMTGVRDYPIGELKHNVVALAQAATALKLPIVVTTTSADSMWGPTFPELVDALPGVESSTVPRSMPMTMHVVARAIEATGRNKLIFAGVSLEVCAAFPAITAVSKGLDAYVAVDASGTFNERNARLGFCVCCRPASSSPTIRRSWWKSSRTTGAQRPAPSTARWTWTGANLSANLFRCTPRRSK